MEFLTILIAIWTYPIIGFLLFRLTKGKTELRRRIFIVIFILSGLAILGILTDISTTLTELDWIILTLPFLTVVILLWWTQFQRNRTIKIAGVVLMAFVFLFSFLVGSVGFLGVGFVVGRFEKVNEEWFDDGLIYKEFSLGNAISDYRGKRVEIYKTVPWFPIIEWQIREKEYYDAIVYLNKLDVKYDKSKNEMILQTRGYWQDSTCFWGDTISLKK